MEGLVRFSRACGVALHTLPGVKNAASDETEAQARKVAAIVSTAKADMGFYALQQFQH